MATKIPRTRRGKQVAVSTVLPPDLIREVKRLCGITGAPMAHYVREGLEMVLAKHVEALSKAAK